MKTMNIFVAATIASFAAGVAVAQTTPFDVENRAQDSVEDLEEAVQDDFERDVPTFGNQGRALGWYGSVSARATATSGNTDTANIGIGTRFGYFDGVNGHDITLSYSYADDAGVVSDNSLLAGYDYTREFGQNYYFFGKIQTAYDEFSSYEQDAFIGAGVGYRIYNTNNIQWSVQAGPGFRYLKDNTGVETEEAALSISSNYFNRINENMFITNDTDILAAESDTAVSNELGLNVSMTDALALRTSLLTEYHSDPLPGFKDTDNTVGVSVVYTFN